MSNQYEKPGVLSKEETLSILNGNNTVEQKVHALVGSVNAIEDHAWLQELCLSYVNHKDKWIAGAAINGLGDIARIFGQLDLKLVLDKLNTTKSERKDLAGKIEDAIDDIKTFVK